MADYHPLKDGGAQSVCASVPAATDTLSAAAGGRAAARLVQVQMDEAWQEVEAAEEALTAGDAAEAVAERATDAEELVQQLSLRVRAAGHLVRAELAGDLDGLTKRSELVARAARSRAARQQEAARAVEAGGEGLRRALFSVSGRADASVSSGSDGAPRSNAALAGLTVEERKLYDGTKRLEEAVATHTESEDIAQRTAADLVTQGEQMRRVVGNMGDLGSYISESSGIVGGLRRAGQQHAIIVRFTFLFFALLLLVILLETVLGRGIRGVADLVVPVTCVLLPLVLVYVVYAYLMGAPGLGMLFSPRATLTGAGESLLSRE